MNPTESRAVPFAAIVLAMLPAVLDQTILATALPTIAGDLGEVSDVSWVVTAYVVAAAATTSLWGKLGDRYGRRRLLELALGLFLAASAACGLAQDITGLILARAVQGVAAGGLMSLAMAAVGDLVPPRERGRYQGYVAAAFAVATGIGSTRAATVHVRRRCGGGDCRLLTRAVAGQRQPDHRGPALGAREQSERWRLDTSTSTTWTPTSSRHGLQGRPSSPSR